VSVLCRCFTVRSGGLPLARLLFLLLAILALLLVPAFALATVCGSDGDGALCQAPDPPGDRHTVVAFLDHYQGCALCGGSVLLAPGRGFAALPGGAPAPQGLHFTVALVGRPPPLGA
jgi:hypothetical protein